jgi:hypothetical protein
VCKVNPQTMGFIEMGLTLSSTSQEPVFSQTKRTAPGFYPTQGAHPIFIMRNYFEKGLGFTCSKAPDQDIAEIGETPLAPALQSQ